MKTIILMIMCSMVAVCVFGAEGKKSASKKTSMTEAELRTMAKATPNAKDAGTLYQVGMATNNVERQQEFFRASAACLLACGKEDIYKKHIKGKLKNAKAFEESLKDKCKQCGGAGMKDRRCYACSGKGRCSSCKGSGWTTSMGFDRANGAKQCHLCRGSGRCGKCGGAGSTKGKCGVCSGIGKIFRILIAERVFRDTCNALADSKSGKQSAADNYATPRARTNGASRQLNSNSKNVVAEAEKEFAKKCNGSGDVVQVDYKGISYGIAGDNFVVFTQDCKFIGGQTFMMGDAHLVVLQSPTHWYNAVKACAGKLEEWVRVAQRNKVKNVSKEIPHGYMDVEGYPNKITAGKGQDELFRKVLRASYSYPAFVPEQIKFIGSVETIGGDFERFTVTLTMVCGEYFNSPVFWTSGTVEQIEKEFVRFLVFTNPASLEKARDEQTKKESLFR